MTFKGTPQNPIFRTRKERDGGGRSWLCDGCNKSYSIDSRDYYVVLDSVWNDEAGLPSEGCMLCRDCLEIRIGRTLVREDFKSAPVNWQVLIWEFGLTYECLLQEQLQKWPGWLESKSAWHFECLAQIPI